MPIPKNYSGSGKNCCVYSKGSYRTAGLGRIFNKARPSPLDNKYVVGAGVGAQSIFVKRALKRRANNKANGMPCCDKPIVNYCQLPPPKNNQPIQHINQSNIHLLSQNTPHTNVYYVITEPVHSAAPLVVDPTSTLCISSTGSLDLSRIQQGLNKLSANDIYNCGTITFGDISAWGNGIFAQGNLILTNNGTITFGDISGVGATAIGVSGGLNLTNNGTIAFAEISGFGTGGIAALGDLNLTNNRTITFDKISGNASVGIRTARALILTNNSTITFGNISASTVSTWLDENYGFSLSQCCPPPLHVKQKGRICVGSGVERLINRQHTPLNTQSCN